MRIRIDSAQVLSPYDTRGLAGREEKRRVKSTKFVQPLVESEGTLTYIRFRVIRVVIDDKSRASCGMFRKPGTGFTSCCIISSRECFPSRLVQALDGLWFPAIWAVYFMKEESNRVLMVYCRRRKDFVSRKSSYGLPASIFFISSKRGWGQGDQGRKCNFLRLPFYTSNRHIIYDDALGMNSGRNSLSGRRGFRGVTTLWLPC